jgi:hypothetical protein
MEPTQPKKPFSFSSIFAVLAVLVALGVLGMFVFGAIMMGGGFSLLTFIVFPALFFALVYKYSKKNKLISIVSTIIFWIIEVKIIDWFVVPYFEK